jgi:orotate phosphoribosyltransferase-like protein
MTDFEGHHQPLRVRVLCLYIKGLNLSNEQIAAELDLDADTVQVMATQYAKVSSSKKPVCLNGEIEADEVYWEPC